MKTRINKLRFKRRTLFEISRIKNEVKAPDYLFDLLSNETYDEKIKEFMSHGNHERNHATLSEIEHRLQTEMISDDELPFIKGNRDVIFFLWGYIYIYYNNAYTPLTEYHFLDKPNRVQFGNFSSIELKKKFLYNYFDLFDTAIQESKEYKMNLIRGAISALKRQYENTKMPKWLSPMNPAGLDWAEQYIKRQPDNEIAQNYYSLTNLLSAYTLSFEKEKYLSILTVFRLWAVHPAVKEKFIHKMNKAWLQERRREEMKDYCNLSCSIKTTNKEKLHLIANHLEFKINKAVEFLIEHVYEDIKNEIKK
ncbi:hypothetical protein [Providencia heimbachae]|uniref:Uncharacterized protein n=1 Tax=Providencia heimbachae ATCC 35613 TaxID=1354272 RepID=A0A1B7JWQ5_9GAMM|nr:hypothetical protein [Providencia heimbachae]OAT52339.1 hypothetical protein M998_1548 [Providencia heimbachae ATCC 35613]SQH14858.1 Uncharacterised protein [Providencia heimbachae]